MLFEDQISERTLSRRKLEANRRNALKSTGPKTESGKANSSRNAVTHGCYIERLNIELCGEDGEEFLKMYAGLREEYQPCGPREEFEVQRIAHMQWRMGRVWRYENAVTGIEQERIFFAQRNEAVLEVTKVWNEVKRIPGFGAPSNRPVSDSIVNDHKTTGESDTMVESQKGPGPNDPKKVVKEIIETFYEKVNHETQLRLAELERAALPIPENLNTILRAEAAADKGLTGAIKRLDQLQAKRKEEEELQKQAKEKENTYTPQHFDDSDDVVTV